MPGPRDRPEGPARAAQWYLGLVTQPPGNGEVMPLTSLRFFAAFYVLLYHTLRGPFSLGHGAFSRLIDTGNVSVSFFFTLSGYILALVYLTQGKPVARRKFWVARIARIYPVFVLTMLLDVPFAVLNRLDHLSVPGALAKVTAGFTEEFLMLQAWWLNWRVLDPPNWSLSVEAFFYLLFPFIGLVLWRMRTQRLLLVTGLIWVAGIAADVFAIRLGFAEKAVMFNPILHLPEFVGGIALCACQRRGATARLSPVVLLGGALAGFLILVFAGVPRVLLNNGLLLPVFAGVILAASSGQPAITRLLSVRWLVHLGRASYALYLLHVPAWELMTLAGWSRSPAAYPLYVFGTIAASLAIYSWIEEPARESIKKLHLRRGEPVLRSLQPGDELG